MSLGGGKKLENSEESHANTSSGLNQRPWSCEETMLPAAPFFHPWRLCFYKKKISTHLCHIRLIFNDVDKWQNLNKPENFEHYHYMCVVVVYEHYAYLFSAPNICTINLNFKQNGMNGNIFSFELNINPTTLSWETSEYTENTPDVSSMQCQYYQHDVTCVHYCISQRYVWEHVV